MGSAVIMERVLNLFRSMLCLNEGEEIEAKFSDTAKERLKLSKYFVVRKVLTRKKFRSSIVMRVIKELWRPKVAVEAMAIREDRILLSFNIEDDMRTVLSGNSWFFGKLLPILAEVKGLKVPVNVSLREQEFWIQIHGLPSSLMSVRMREILGVTIGRVVKINMDGAMNGHTNMRGVKVGWVLGGRGAAVSRRHLVVVESDSLKAIAVPNGTYIDSSAIGMIAEDVLQLASTFSMARFIHVSHLCNRVAYHLAKFALSSSNNLIWIKEPPTFIQELLLQDICNSA
ncbi:hypothetical protein DVH24_035644 [Malus domestica]|uniref:RNase H type-1 domain-containing protein n=1 Tax=Malus domestica TaxID=3750 RepID=A0A498JPJ1_MALDO|nr:hypothetical protein DVH24_035644 [Malus domestica]